MISVDHIRLLGRTNMLITHRFYSLSENQSRFHQTRFFRLLLLDSIDSCYLPEKLCRPSKNNGQNRIYPIHTLVSSDIHPKSAALTVCLNCFRQYIQAAIRKTTTPTLAVEGRNRSGKVEQRRTVTRMLTMWRRDIWDPTPTYSRSWGGTLMCGSCYRCVSTTGRARSRPAAAAWTLARMMPSEFHFKRI